LGLVVTYAEGEGRVRVSYAQPLAPDQSMFLRLRRGKYGTLDCAEVVATTDPIDTSSGGGDYPGPLVTDPELLKPFYGPEWQAESPTPEMIAAARAGVDRIIDTCVVRGFDATTRAYAGVDVAVETDFDVAWDAGIAAAKQAARTKQGRAGALDTTEQ